MTEIRDVYSRITGKIIADLEQGIRPWHSPPTMIAAGVVFLESEALNCFSRCAVSDHFALGLYPAMETERLRAALGNGEKRIRGSRRRSQ